MSDVFEEFRHVNGELRKVEDGDVGARGDLSANASLSPPWMRAGSKPKAGGKRKRRGDADADDDDGFVVSDDDGDD